MLFVLLLCTTISTLATPPPTGPCAGDTFRHYNGTCNNLANPTRGAINTFYSRAYGFDCESRVLRVFERNLTNTFFSEESFKDSSLYNTEERRFGLSPNPFRLNALITGFHQLVEHDRGSAKLKNCFSPFNECFINSPTPSDDFLYMTTDEGFNISTPRTGLFIPKMAIDNTTGVPQSINEQTAYLDGSAIYGPTAEIAAKLRTFSDGKLKMRYDVGDGALGELPDSKILGVPNQCSQFGPFGMASGDPRTETNSVLAAIHTLFVREHNRLAKLIKLFNWFWNDEKIFQAARNYNIALLQHFAVDELLPSQFGQAFADENVGEYSGYSATADVTLSTPFGLAANRIVHDQVNLPMLVINSTGSRITLPGTEGFPTIERINCISDQFWQWGTDSILRGATQQFAQKLDGKVVDDIRSFPAKSSTSLPYNFDVEAMTLSRPIEIREISYYHLRKALGDDLYTQPGCAVSVSHTTSTVAGVSCPKVVRSPDAGSEDPIGCFNLISGNATRAAELKKFYGRVDRVHAHVGMMVEGQRTATGFPITGAKLFAQAINAARAGDRFWYENYESHGLLTGAQVREIKRTSFYDFIRRNTNLRKDEVNDAAFTVVTPN